MYRALKPCFASHLIGAFLVVVCHDSSFFYAVRLAVIGADTIILPKIPFALEYTNFSEPPYNIQQLIELLYSIMLNNLNVVILQSNCIFVMDTLQRGHQSGNARFDEKNEKEGKRRKRQFFLARAKKREFFFVVWVNSV